MYMQSSWLLETRFLSRSNTLLWYCFSPNLKVIMIAQYEPNLNCCKIMLYMYMQNTFCVIMQSLFLPFTCRSENHSARPWTTCAETGWGGRWTTRSSSSVSCLAASCDIPWSCVRTWHWSTTVECTTLISMLSEKCLVSCATLNKTHL